VGFGKKYISSFTAPNEKRHQALGPGTLHVIKDNNGTLQEVI
jgi:hypothetical protein